MCPPHCLNVSKRPCVFKGHELYGPSKLCFILGPLFPNVSFTLPTTCIKTIIFLKDTNYMTLRIFVIVWKKKKTNNKKKKITKNYPDFLRGNQNSFGVAILLDPIASSTNHFHVLSAPDMYALQLKN